MRIVGVDEAVVNEEVGVGPHTVTDENLLTGVKPRRGVTVTLLHVRVIVGQHLYVTNDNSVTMITWLL